jgi:hypothetical protein
MYQRFHAPYPILAATLYIQLPPAHNYSKTCLKRNLKGPEHCYAEAWFPLNQGILR